MDSKNPHPEVRFSLTSTRQNGLNAVGSSASRHTPRLAETAFAYQSFQSSATAMTPSGVQHARAIMYPTTDESSAAGEPMDDQPIIVPVLGAQPVTQPLLQAQDRDYEDLDYRWPDDQDQDNIPDDDTYFEPELEPQWRIPAGISEPAFTQDDEFRLRERSRDGWKRFRRNALLLLSFTLMLSVAVFGAAVAASYAMHATAHVTITSPIPTVSSYSNGVVVQPGSEAVTPTPEAPKYQIGAWLSNNAPSGGSVKVFVRLTQDVEPIPQIPVTLVVQLPGGPISMGPTKTDAYGLATFTVKFGGVSRVPIFVTASAKVGASDLTAETVFVPI